MPVDGVSGSTLTNYNVNNTNTNNTNTNNKTSNENDGFSDRLDKVPDADYSYSSGSSAAPSKDLTSTDFLKLLAAQLQYQDMTNPMSNSEMMSTLTQMSSMNATNSMVNAISTVTSSMNDMLTVNLTSYATGMMGKEVTIALVDKDGKATGEKITGVVEGISLYEGSPMVYVDGKGYPLSQVMSIGTVPKGESGEDTGSGTDAEESTTIDMTDKIDSDKTDTDNTDKVDADKTDTDATDTVDTDKDNLNAAETVDPDKTDTDKTDNDTADNEDSQQSAEGV